VLTAEVTVRRGLGVDRSSQIERFDGSHRDGLRTAEPTRVLLRLCGWAVQRNLELQGLQVTQPSLEEVYLQLTEDAADDGD
jgi:hypothetical protein